MILVTGHEGFVGKHLCRLLEEDGEQVWGFSYRTGHDLLNYEQLRRYLDETRPTHIFHLAAQAFVPESLSNPYRTFQVNTLGSVNLLEAVRQLGIKTKVLLVGTSEEYGDSKGILNETALPRPNSPYAVSKLAMDYLGQMYAKIYGLDIVVTRAFNHTGAGRGQMYAESSFAKQIVECELGKREVVEHGNLDSVRNYTDVRDVVKAYRLAIDLPPDVYNICSPNSVPMKDILDLLIKNSKVKIKTKVNESLYRAGDFSFSFPSSRKFRQLTNWEPEYSLEDTMISLLEYWRENSYHR